MLWTGSRLIRFFNELFSSSLCLISLLCCETRARSTNTVLILKKMFVSCFSTEISLEAFPLSSSGLHLYLPRGVFFPHFCLFLCFLVSSQSNYTCQLGFLLLTVECWAAVGYSFYSICWIKASTYIKIMQTPCFCVCCHSVKKYIHVCTITMHQGINNK